MGWPWVPSSIEQEAQCSSWLCCCLQHVLGATLTWRTAKGIIRHRSTKERSLVDESYINSQGRPSEQQWSGPSSSQLCSLADAVVFCPAVVCWLPNCLRWGRAGDTEVTAGHICKRVCWHPSLGAFWGESDVCGNSWFCQPIPAAWPILYQDVKCARASAHTEGCKDRGTLRCQRCVLFGPACHHSLHHQEQSQMHRTMCTPIVQSTRVELQPSCPCCGLGFGQRPPELIPHQNSPVSPFWTSTVQFILHCYGSVFYPGPYKSRRREEGWSLAVQLLYEWVQTAKISSPDHWALLGPGILC